MSNSNSSMIIVVIMIMAMVFSVAMSGGLGLYGYKQGWFETDPPAPPPSTTDGNGDDEEDTKDDSVGSVPTLDKSVYIYANNNCTKDEEGKKWHRMLIDSTGTYDPAPILWCKQNEMNGQWKISKVEKYYYYIRNQETKNYLAVINGNLAMTDSKSDDAKWSIYKQKENNVWGFRNKGGKFLNVKGNNCSHVPRNNDHGLRVYDQDKKERFTLPEEFTWKIGTASVTTSSVVVPTEWQSC